MPISSNAATVDRKKAFKTQNPGNKSIDQNESPKSEKNLLKIAPALPLKNRRSFYVRSHSFLNALPASKVYDAPNLCDSIVVQAHTDGTLHVSRLQEEKEALPDRISLDRRGLTVVPIIEGEPKLRLLSLQHNLLSNLEVLSKQQFPSLVFLDIYDNQLEEMQHLDKLENLRVLLMGKNRIKKIEGLENLSKIEVLDLHGNQITQVGGLATLTELKVLNLAANQIRVIGAKDLHGLNSLQELNLRRNKLKKLLGFSEVPNLSKLFISNNDLQSIDDINSLAMSTNIKEISIDNNPISLGGDCVSFLVSYLQHLIKLNSMLITEQVRKAAMAWRRNKESSNSAFMDLTSDLSTNFKREEVISNARTNWELLRSQTKCLTNNAGSVEKTTNLKPDSDFVLTSLVSQNSKNNVAVVKTKTEASVPTKVPLLNDKKFKLVRTSSQDTENSQNSSSNVSSNELFKLPPILIPLISKMELKSEEQNGSLKGSGSLSSVGPTVDSSLSSFSSGSEITESSTSSVATSSVKDFDLELEAEVDKEKEVVNISENPLESSNKNGTSTETASVLSGVTTTSSISVPSKSSGDNVNKPSLSRSVKSAVQGKSMPKSSYNPRASTAKIKKPYSPALPKDREQGGDYLIEISGRYLNVYGQAALRFIDKSWNSYKANDVNIVKFNYVNFNTIIGFLNRLKQRFPNIDTLIFKETNIASLGQLNALAEIQGLTSLFIDTEGNPIVEKKWKSYAIYRLSHWGLKTINDKQVTEQEVNLANEEYQGLSDLVFSLLPDVLLQPLLIRLEIDTNQNVIEDNPKKWLLSADQQLRNVVCKEALQWKKGSLSQEETLLRQKAKQNISSLLDETENSINKLILFEQKWPTILHSFVQNTLLDYSQLDLYMKQKIQEITK